MIVRVYWNITKQCWSVQHKNKVIGRYKSLLLKNVTFKVYQSGRVRCMFTKVKNVHAFTIGEIEAYDIDKPIDYTLQVSYNPYKFGHFYYINDNSAIFISESVYCGDKIIFVKG